MTDFEEVTQVLRGSRVLVALAARALAAYAENATFPQLRALVLVGKRGPLRPIDVAGELDIDSSTATRLADRLVRKGLLDRQRDEVDRRVVTLSLTADGTRLLDAVSAHRRSAISDLLDRMDPADREHLRLGLHALAEVGAEGSDGSGSHDGWTLSWDGEPAATLAPQQPRE